MTRQARSALLATCSPLLWGVSKINEVGSASSNLPTRPPGAFGTFVASARRTSSLIVQPRMGFGSIEEMRRGLLATRRTSATTVGTITLDSYTRTGDLGAAWAAVREGRALNGYPLLTHDLSATRKMLDGIHSDDFPIQVRHGSARPQEIVAALIGAGLDATEGGPASYCLPYSRLALRDSVENWAVACELLAAARTEQVEPHLETFGGCLMGQLCPPGLLVAVSVLEAMFFVQHGLRSISLSYAQQTDFEQDLAALSALHRLAGRWLPGVDWHVVVYTYMGLFPRTSGGARLLIEQSARLAVRSGAARLIVKTAVEASRIPSIKDNAAALVFAAEAARRETAAGGSGSAADHSIEAEASALIEAVAGLDADVGRSIVRAFALGYLDVPHCLHPDNANRAKSYIDASGRLKWSSVGAMPIAPGHGGGGRSRRTSSAGLLWSLSHVARSFDHESAAAEPASRSSRPTAPAFRRSGRPDMFEDPSHPMPDGPLDPREHLTSPTTRAALRIQAALLTAARRYLTEAGFIELLPPIIGPVTDPGIRGSKQIDVDFYGHRYKLMTSAILYKQTSLLAFDKIFYIAPNVRLEPPDVSSTRRHLVEFHQIDVEMAEAGRADVMRLLEDLLRHQIAAVESEHGDELAALGRSTGAFKPLQEQPFDRMTHAAAVTALHELGHEQSSQAEIDWHGEEVLSRAARTPFFVTDYPKGSRGFYDRESRSEPGLLRNFDLIAPEGFGELCSGSEREFEHRRLVSRIRETSENPAKYGWYLEAARLGIPSSAGFGIGVERLTRYMAGLDGVWQASAYPKFPGMVSA